MKKILTEAQLSADCLALAAENADFAFILNTYKTPPLWKREPTFAVLVQIILEQQVSLAAARAAFEKLSGKLNGEFSPENLLTLSDEELKASYLSRQKTVYVRELAKAIIEKRLDLPSLETVSDDEVRAELIKIKGIGRWTADIYLLMAMSRADVMPKGDLALHIAWRRLKNLEQNPTSEEFQQIAENWSPYRTAAAHLLWHYYLSAK